MKKRTFYEVYNIHPNTPSKLVTELHKAEWNRRELARRLEVNVFYINQLVNNGEEPTDATENGRAIRVKLFLRAHKPKQVEAKPKPILPTWLVRRKRAIRGMVKATNDAVVRRR